MLTERQRLLTVKVKVSKLPRFGLLWLSNNSELEEMTAKLKVKMRTTIWMIALNKR